MRQFIVLHHSLTRDGTTVNWQAIRRYHRQRGWDDIGYHYGVELVRGDYEILLGRMPDVDGAHCREMGMNRRAYGVCLIGNYQQVPPPPAAIDKVVELVRFLMRRDGIRAENVIGHREAGKMANFDWTKGQYKDCPGAAWSMERFREFLL
jgi:hypothetical protein